MPSRNIIRNFAPHQYYHVYNRGVAKQPIFLDSRDKRQFLKIMARHLDPQNKDTKNDGMPYPKYPHLELLAYCLMKNHFHLVLYQGKDAASLKSFMQSVLIAYTMYFNKKYKRVGPLFQGVYRASLIDNDSYLTHISRYVHRNPRRYATYFYSSIRYYRGDEAPAWLKPQRILDMFEGADYTQFLDDYEEHAAILDEIKFSLADK